MTASFSKVRAGLEPRFEAVAQALAAGADVVAVCAAVGRHAARDGAALGEALDGLRATYSTVRGTTPDFAATEALAVAWSESTLEYLHQISCEDPLTGLATLAHMQTRLRGLYREAERVGEPVPTTRGLVVVETRPATGPLPNWLTCALRLVRITESMRSVFSGDEPIGRAGLDRAVVVVRRDPQLAPSVARLRALLEPIDLDPAGLRVWIEDLPADAGSAARLLDELARS